jgi:hypothetical protein
MPVPPRSKHVLLRGYAEWEPQPHVRELLRQVEEVFDLYSAHRPLAARQVFYRLVAARGWSSPSDGLSASCAPSRTAGAPPRA